MSCSTLAYVALVSRDAEATARFFGDHLGLSRVALAAGGARDKVAVFRVGAAPVAVFPAGHPFVAGADKPGVHHIALAAPDLRQAREALAGSGLSPGDAEEGGLDGRRRLLLDPAATGGVKTWLSEPLGLEPGRSERVERIDHLGVASADNALAVRAFCGGLGCDLESQQTDMEVSIPVESFTSDKYGAVYHARAPELIGGLRSWFVTVGDCELEFLQDFDPHHGAKVQHGVPGNTRQDRGAIARFVASRGPGLHHIAFKTPDINALLPALHRAGIDVIDFVGRPGSRRALIGFIQPKSVGGILVHFAERG